MKPHLPSGHKLWVNTKDYVMIVFALALYAFGFCAFVLPEKVVIGGVTGLGTIVYFLTGTPVAITQYGVNLILLAMAFRTVGRQFVLRTIFGATTLSLFVAIFQPMFPDGLVQGEPFMNIIIGSLCCGVALGLTFVHNGSSGGTDIVAAMVTKKSNVSIGRVMLYVDLMIISSSYFLFHNINSIVYGFVFLVMSSYMVDYVINTNRQAVQFMIFSRRWEAIATAINNDAHRGCTVLNGMGWYTKKDVKMLLVMCRKIESVTIYRIIKSIDENAFITKTNVNGIYGKGFDELKLKAKKHHESEDDMENEPNPIDDPVVEEGNGVSAKGQMVAE